MRSIWSRWPLLLLTCGLSAGCGAAPGPPERSFAPAAPAPVAASASPARQAQTAEDERTRYVARAIAGSRLPELNGLRRVGTGTGFYISADSVLTNFHVIGSCQRLTIGNGVEGIETLAKLGAADSDHDLAVLTSTGKVDEPARFETSIYTESGEGLAIVGYPEHGLSVLLAELSPVTARRGDLAAEQTRFQFSGAVRRGNSGSPVLDESGAVVGIVEAKIDTISVYQHTGNVIDNIGFAISNRVVLDFLRANKIAFLPAVAAPGLTEPQLLDKAHTFVRQIGCWR